jgi:LytS/YehU family sensor histidine kinase
MKARVEGESLVIRIADDGPGDESDAKQGEGLGLASVRRRLAAVYGGRGRMEIANAAGGAYAVTLRIPAE